MQKSMPDAGQQSLSQYHMESLKNASGVRRHNRKLKTSDGCLFVGVIAAAVWLVDAWIATLLQPVRFVDAMLLNIPAAAVYTRVVLVGITVLSTLLVFRLIAVGRLDRALQRSSKWFSTTLKSVGAALIAVDKNGRVIFMNPMAQTLTGWRLKHAIGRSLANVCRLIQDSGNSDCKQMLHQLIEEGIPVQFHDNTRLQNADGSEPWITGNATPIMDADGEIIGSVFALHDVTAAKQAEATRVRLATVVDQADDAILIANTAGIIDYINPSFEKIIGYPSTEIIGDHIERFQNEHHDKAFFRTVLDDLDADAVWRGRLSLSCADGSICQLQSAITPTADAAGNIIDYVSINRDITHEVELQQQLTQAQKMEAVGRLAGGIAHDFNNILTVIKGYAVLAKQALDGDSNIHRYVSELEKAGDSAAMLTRQLLAFSRKEAMQATVTNANSTIIEISKMLERLIATNVEFDSQLADDLKCIKVDPGQLGQVLMNLVVNASDAMPDGGQVHIHTINVTLEVDGDIRNLPAGDYVRIEVRDTGIGMDEGTVSRIFEPFFTTKQVGKGTGLGLAMVYGFVKQAGGDVQVRSAPNRGTRFSLYLPAVEGAAISTKAQPVDVIKGGTETILVVEDEPQIRDLAVGVLERSGYNVLSAANGSEALAVAEDNDSIDLMLTDIIMPYVNGFKLADAVSEQYPETAILFMSGRIDDDSCRGRDMAVVTESLLQKPFSPNRLLQHVRERLDVSEEA